jgi:hypothetical protein
LQAWLEARRWRPPEHEEAARTAQTDELLTEAREARADVVRAGHRLGRLERLADAFVAEDKRLAEVRARARK